jgi:hypothetical protein
MKSSIAIIRKFIREEIGRNFHTLDNSPYTFDDLDDYNVEIISNSIDDNFLLDVYFQGEKISPSGVYKTHEEAHHASRMIIDRDRVKRMNNGA